MARLNWYMATAPDPLCRSKCLLEHARRPQRLRPPETPSTTANTEVDEKERDKGRTVKVLGSRADLKHLMTPERDRVFGARQLSARSASRARPRRDHRVALPSNAGSAAGKSARRCAPRLSVRASAQRAISRASGMRVAQQTREALAACARCRRRATAPRASRPRPALGRARRERVQLGGSPAARGAGSGWTARSRRRARANTKHSLSELDASRLAPCSPVHDDSPTA